MNKTTIFQTGISECEGPSTNATAIQITPTKGLLDQNIDEMSQGTTNDIKSNVPSDLAMNCAVGRPLEVKICSTIKLINV